MRLRFWYIVVVFLAVASCTGPRTIPRDKLGDIFHDMFLQDQQIRSDLSLRKIADTSLVYQGIFKEYGYDTDDYLHTINKYIKDPEKLSKVFEKVANRLQAESDGIKKEKEFLEWQTKFLAIYNHRVDTTSLPRVPLGAVDTMYFRLHKDEVQFFPPPDTLSPVIDTLVLRVPADTVLIDTLKVQSDSL